MVTEKHIFIIKNTKTDRCVFNIQTILGYFRNIVYIKKQL